MKNLIIPLALSLALAACSGSNTETPAKPAAQASETKLAPKPPKPAGREQAPELSPETIKALQAAQHK